MKAFFVSPLFGLIMLILCGGWPCTLFGGLSTSVEPGIPLSSSRSKLQLCIRALQSENWLLRRRAIQDLANERYRDEKVATAILRLLQENRLEGEMYDLVPLLPSVEKVSPVLFSDTLTHSKGSSFIALASATGYMHTNSEAFVNALKALVSQPQLPEQQSVVARVSLAALGIARATNTALIAEYIAGSKSGLGDVIMAMLLNPSRDWIDDSILRSLPALIRSGNPTAVLSAVLAGSLGEKARSTLPAVEEAARTLRAQHSGSAFICFDFAAARIENGTNWIREGLLTELGSDEVGFDHSVASACLLLGNALIHRADIHTLNLFLDARDPNTVRGAITLCWAIGLPAKDAERRLIGLLSQSSNAGIRERAAMALGMVGTAHSLRQMQAVHDSEDQTGVRDSISQAISLIQLREP